MTVYFSFVLKPLFTVRQSIVADVIISDPISLFVATHTFDIMQTEFLAASWNELQIKKMKYLK